MSRGPGVIQTAILELVFERPGRSEGEIRWTTAERLGRLEQDGLSPAFYGAFQRAIRVLSPKRTGRIRRVPRRLLSIDEVVEHYAHATRSLDVLTARRTVLPELLRIADDWGPRFSTARSERHVVERTLEGMSGRRRARVESNWSELELHLLEALTTTSQEEREVVIAVLNKCREYLDPSAGVTLTSTLSSLAPAFHTLAARGPPLEQASVLLRKLLALITPRQAMTSALLKAQLYKVAIFSKRERPHLHANAREELWRRCPNLLRALPGHPPPPQHARDSALFEALFRNHPPDLSPVLDQLLGRDVLRAINFLYPRAA